jgi:putative membrane protein
LACVAAALIGPLAVAARTSFTAHMAGHLLLGMLAPLLLVLAAPVTLALCALPASRARVVSRLLRYKPLRVITHPVTAAVLNAGGLWLLYTTDLFRLMHNSVLVHVAVHAHVLVAGYLFTAAIVAIDPNPHRASIGVRSVVLIGFIAVHSILAKWLYAHPPVGVDIADARAGAQLMYYGGDVVDVALIVLLFTGWYRATRPRDRTAADRAAADSTAATGSLPPAVRSAEGEPLGFERVKPASHRPPAP